jgi:hypothetical protein
MAKEKEIKTNAMRILDKTAGEQGLNIELLREEKKKQK